MGDQFEQVTVNLTNNKVQFTGISPSNPDRPIVFDYKPPIGDGNGYNGLEFLLMSLTGIGMQRHGDFIFIEKDGERRIWIES